MKARDQKAWDDNWQLPARSYTQIEEVDKMPADLRACVYEFSYTIVKACLQNGVTKPSQIRQLVTAIWDGARQPLNAPNFRQSSFMSQLDWLLMQAGAQISAIKLVRFLNMHHWTIVSMSATAPMVNASLEEVSGFNVTCSKREKHKRRLEAAIKAGSMSLFPHLYSTKQLTGVGES